jgi:hypothetical protein
VIALAVPAVERLGEAELRAWIRDHRVCWETIAHREIGPHGLLPIGYDVVLCARSLGPGAWDGGGEVALETWERLEQLATAVTPGDCEEEVALGPFEPRLQMRPQEDWQPEVRLVLEIRHDHEYFAAIDDEERLCVRRIERALERWGAQPGAWPATLKTQPTAS